MIASWQESYGKPRQCIKKQRHHFANKGPYSQGYSQSLSSSHVQMWELKHKEGRALKSWCFQTAVLEKTPESPLDRKEIKPVKPKGNQPWIFIARTDPEAEATILWPTDVKRQLHRKRPWCWESLKAEGEECNRGWDGWMASLIQWMWVWASSGRWWRTAKPDVLQSMGWQRVGRDSERLNNNTLT